MAQGSFHFEDLFRFVVAYLFALLCNCKSRIPLSEMVGVTIDIFQQYQSTCIYLIHSTQQQGTEDDLVKILSMKEFSSQRITASFLSLEDFNITLLDMDFSPLFVLISNDREITRWLGKISTYDSFTNGVWLLFKDRQISLEAYFSQIRIPYDLDFLVAEQANDVEIITILEAYHVHSTGALHTNPLGNWSTTSGLSWTTIPFHQRRGNLHGATIRVGFCKQEPFVKKSSSKSPSPQGTMRSIWNVLEKRMNFTRSRYYMSPVQNTGILEDYGSWTGVIGMIVRGEVDVGLNHFTFTRDRLKAVDFLPPLWNSKVMVFIKEPKQKVTLLSNITAPLSKSTWLAVLVAIIVLTCSLSYTWHVDCKYNRELVRCSRSYGFYNATLCVYGSFCIQPQSFTPENWPCRLVFLTSYITAMVTFMAYSANFISSLTTRQLDYPFVDFQGLLDDGRYHLGVLPGSAHAEYFKDAGTGVLKEVYERLIKPVEETLPDNYIEGLNRVCSENNFAFFMPRLLYRGLQNNLQCHIAEVFNAFYTVSSSVTISKRNPYKRLFTHYIYDMRSYGILDRIRDHTAPRMPVEIIQDLPPGVTMETAHIFFVILVSGIVMSAILCLLEVFNVIICWRNRKSLTRKIIRRKNSTFLTKITSFINYEHYLTKLREQYSHY